MKVYSWFITHQRLRYLTSALVLALLYTQFVLLASASGMARSHMCVPEKNGGRNCGEGSEISLRELRKKPEQCEDEDYKCWCMKAIAYTNEVRRRNGKTKMLKPGPMTQLQNARRYAVTLASIGNLKHQDLAAATKDVGCNRRIGGENIAYNYEKRDVAFSCVQQWESSPAHLVNILKESFDEVVVGFFKTHDGRVYCVQTFSVANGILSESNGNNAQCESISQRIQDETEQETSNVGEDENVKGETVNPSTGSESNFVTEGTVNGDKMNSNDEKTVEDVPQHSPNSEYYDDEPHIDVSNGEIEGPVESEEAATQSQGQDALQTEDGGNLEVEAETLHSNNQDPRADEGDSEESAEGLLHMSAENIADIASTISADGDHLLSEYGENRESDPSTGHAQAAGKKESRKDEELKEPEAGEHLTVAPEDDDSQELYYGESQTHAEKEDDIDEKRIQNEVTEGKKQREENVNIGNRACRCLELGNKCWHSLEEQTDKLCISFQPTGRQTTACKLKCCSYCLTKLKTKRCTNKVVKKLCRKLRKVIENNV